MLSLTKNISALRNNKYTNNETKGKVEYLYIVVDVSGNISSPTMHKKNQYSDENCLIIYPKYVYNGSNAFSTNSSYVSLLEKKL